MEIRNIYNDKFGNSFCKDLQNGAIHHAYMLETADNVMLEKFATFMAEELVAFEASDGELERQKVEHGTHPDVLWYGKELKGKMLTIEEINTVLSDVMLAPMDSKYKVMIIDQFDKANIIAQNKFLKTLEEPPTGVVFLLLCQSSTTILTTIKSRCQKIRIPLCTKGEIQEYLTDYFGVKSNLEDVVFASMGNLSQAIKLYQDDEYQTLFDLCLDIITKMTASSQVLYFSSKLLEFKDRILECISLIEQFLGDIAKYNHQAIDEIVFVNNIKNYQAMNVFYSDKAIAEIIKRMSIIRKILKSNCQTQGVIDQMLLGILEVRYQCK